jgi:hypothetical protein
MDKRFSGHAAKPKKTIAFWKDSPHENSDVFRDIRFGTCSGSQLGRLQQWRWWFEKSCQWLLAYSGDIGRFRQ